MDLKGKVALITGASQGLGAYAAEVLAEQGAHVAIAARSEEKLHKIAERIRKKGARVLPLVLEMTDYPRFDSAVQEIVKQLGSLDILVNNAAISVDRNMVDISLSDWDQHMDTNLKGLFFLSQSAARQMIRQKRSGTIINIAAINGDHIRKNCIPFSVSKAGVIHLTKAMAYELIDHNIRVNAISPGLVASEPVQEWLDSDPSAQDYLARIPAKRAAHLSELKGPLLLLASDASSYMYGAILKVDGGFCIDVFLNLDI
ncbi:MAG TPA: SDR family oxidoreductase [Rhabdochlamydiaceae bacterium]|jgi:NAD(P)-dependent dehydrogenase (short-subunit alcohol dehydrogenase family)